MYFKINNKDYNVNPIIINENAIQSIEEKSNGYVITLTSGKTIVGHLFEIVNDLKKEIKFLKTIDDVKKEEKPKESPKVVLTEEISNEKTEEIKDTKKKNK